MSDRLLPNQSLLPGQELDAVGQPVRCVLQADGVLGVYWGSSGFTIWATSTAGLQVTRATMQPDGNFVLYAGSAPVWTSGTAGNPGAYLVVQDDGELVVLSSSYVVLWRSGTVVVSAPPRASSVLSGGEAFGIGQFLQAPKQPFTCVLQADGSLAILKLGSAPPLWVTPPAGRVAAAVMQPDGNFVLYGAGGVTVWTSGTAGNPHASVVMQDDGNLVIYLPDGRPIWASNTVQPPVPLYWAIVLCKFTDIAAEPQPSSWYADYYCNPAAGGAAAYWQTVTNGVIDISSTQVFGWFTTSHSTSELQSMTFPGDRWKLAQWGRDTAHANGVDLSPFQRVLTVLNYSTDSGAVGVPGDFVLGHGTPQYTDLAFVCHEMGHGYGLQHSWSANPDMEYGDGFDLMSFNTATYNFSNFITAPDGVIGYATVGLNAHNLAQLGALVPPGQAAVPGAGPIASPTAASDFSDPLVLNALSQSPRNSSQWRAFQIPQSDGTSFLVEGRRKAQWDRAIPVDNVVLIHQVRTDGRSYLYPTYRAYLLTGQSLATPDPEVVISVGSWDGDLVTIWAWDLPDGALRTEVSDSRVYLMEGGRKRWVVNEATLKQIQETTGRVVRPVADGGLAGIPSGPNIALLNVSTSPHPPAQDKQVQVTVTATDPVTNAAVTGDVELNGSKVGTTGVPFDHTFVGYPQGWSVVAPTYLATPIDFGFVPVVPDVIGDTTVEAVTAIHTAGLSALAKQTVVLTGKDLGLVMSQSPKAGTVLPPEEIVTIWIGISPWHPPPNK